MCQGWGREGVGEVIVEGLVFDTQNCLGAKVGSSVQGYVTLLTWTSEEWIETK